MFAQGEVDLGTSSALTVPQSAVVVRDGFSYVFKVAKGNRVEQIKVLTSRRSGDRIEIAEGIKPDTVIVALGAGFLSGGDYVRIENGVPIENSGASTPENSTPKAPHNSKRG